MARSNILGISVDTRRLFDMASLFRRAAGSYKFVFDNELSKLSKKIHKNVSRAAPKRTGKLVGNIDELKVSYLHYEIREPGPERVRYAIPVRAGVKRANINPILPRRKKALWWPGLPHPISIVRRHPGIKPNDYYKVGLIQSERDIDNSAAAIGRKIQVKFIR